MLQGLTRRMGVAALLQHGLFWYPEILATGLLGPLCGTLELGSILYLPNKLN